jgi:hypothetical protein
MSITCVAVVVFRNEREVLEQLLPCWLDEGLELIGIDHDSTDGSGEWLKAWLGKGVLSVQWIPWLGHFSLQQQLVAKQNVIKEVRHDWVMHLDADEWPQSNRPDERLLDAFQRLGAAGATAVNFEEFVFLPIDARPPHCRYYYHFAPSQQRLVRAWQRKYGFNNLQHGGHRLEKCDATSPQIANESLVLRHYIAQSEEHAAAKYTSRIFDPKEVGNGWHHNRIGLSKGQLRFPKQELLQTLPTASARPTVSTKTHVLHYWHWSDNREHFSPRTLICLYGCDADAELLEVFENTQLAKWLRHRGDCNVLEVWAGGEGRPLVEGQRLTLPIPEQYGQLSRKTWRMIRYCSQHLDFQQLVKLDLSCVRRNWEGSAYAGRQPIDLGALQNYLEHRLDNPLPQKDLENPHYDGFIHHKQPRRQDVEAWGERKGAKLDLDRIWPEGKEPPSFFSGKCYAISTSLARFISQKGKQMAKAHRRYLHGSEDLMIARLAIEFMDGST